MITSFEICLNGHYTWNNEMKEYLASLDIPEDEKPYCEINNTVALIHVVKKSGETCTVARSTLGRAYKALFDDYPEFQKFMPDFDLTPLMKIADMGPWVTTLSYQVVTPDNVEELQLMGRSICGALNDTELQQQFDNAVEEGKLVTFYYQYTAEEDGRTTFGTDIDQVLDDVFGYRPLED